MPVLASLHAMPTAQKEGTSMRVLMGIQREVGNTRRIEWGVGNDLEIKWEVGDDIHVGTGKR